MISVGEVYESNGDGNFEVVEYKNYKNIRIRFIDTGFETWTQGIHITNGAIKDRIRKTCAGVGFIGVGPYSAGVGKRGGSTTVYNIWSGMISRCYNPDDKNYQTYKDCIVCEEWHNFQNYARWFESNMPADYSSTKYHVDKDLLVPGNRVYSPEFCHFVLASENILAGSANATVKQSNVFKTIIKSPSGELHEFINLREFATKHNLNIKTLQIARKQIKQDFLGGWSIIAVEEIGNDV